VAGSRYEWFTNDAQTELSQGTLWRDQTAILALFQPSHAVNGVVSIRTAPERR